MRSEDRLCLLGILESIGRIDDYIKSIHSYEDFAQDSKTMDACLMHLVNIGEMTTRLSEELQSDHSDIEWHKIRGMLNIIAYDYFGIDDQEIWSIVSIHIPTLKQNISRLVIQ